MAEPKKSNIWRELGGWIKTIFFAVCFAFFLNYFVIVNATVPSPSMENTIMTDDRIIAFRLSYLFSTPNRFDIVVFPSPEDNELNVKRVIGLPGDTIMIVTGRIYINDLPYPLRDDFTHGILSGNFGPIRVPDGHVFVMGDFRSISRDGRHWEDTNFVNQDDILGRVIFRYHPNFARLR